MAKKIRFPLVMADTAEVRDLMELKEHFDLETVISYYKNGKLLVWLNDRYLEEEATAVESLNEKDAGFQRQLCEIFGVEFTGEDVDLEEVARRQERLAKLREFTDEAEFIDHIDQVAFNQEELADLLDEGVDTIYLCGKSFNIPVSVKNKRYIGINDPEIVVSAKSKMDFAENEISFTNTHFYTKYLNLIKNADNRDKSNFTENTSTHYTSRKKPYKLYSQMLDDYEVDDDGRRYKEITALYICDLSTHEEHALYVPSLELIKNGFSICATYVCGDNIYFTARVPHACAAFQNDPAEAELRAGCVLKCNVSSAVPMLICNTLDLPIHHDLFVSPNGTLVIAEKEGLSASVMSIPERNYCILSSQKQTEKVAKILSQRNFDLSYVSKGYNKLNSVNFAISSDYSASGFWLSSTKHYAYFLVQTRAKSQAGSECKQYLYEFPIDEDTDFRVAELRFCNSYMIQPPNIYIERDLLLYFVSDNLSSTIKLFRRKNLRTSEELILQDTLSNYSNKFVQKNPIFTVRDGKVFCCYNEKIKPTYICDLPHKENNDDLA